jgi:ATP-binding cassette subfamily C (CFTR/MRP) protein 1
MCLTNLGIVCVASRYMAASIPVILFVLYWIQRFYLRTSRQIRLLDLEARSPLYKHFTETLEGLTTIRALCWGETFNQTALRILDVSQKPYYTLFIIQRWLSLVLECTVAGIGVLVVALALRLPGSSGGAVGVALTSILGFNVNLQSLISSWTNAEMALGSVARTRSFMRDTPKEVEPENFDNPGLHWPQGRINVSDMKVEHS